MDWTDRKQPEYFIGFVSKTSQSAAYDLEKNMSLEIAAVDQDVRRKFYELVFSSDSPHVNYHAESRNCKQSHSHPQLQKIAEKPPTIINIAIALVVQNESTELKLTAS